MIIGLLVSELEDREVKKICIGADQAARDKDVTLVIFPGKYLVNEIGQDEQPHVYPFFSNEYVRMKFRTSAPSSR